MSTPTISLAIKATPAQVWEALTSPTLSPAYYYGYAAQFGDLQAGSDYRYSADGQDTITGTVVSAEPNRELVTTFRGHWAPEVEVLPESTVSFRISEPAMPMPGVTVLTCRHEGLPAGAPADQMESGWVTILSGLKTVLETGAPLSAPAQV